ncbi:MAG: HlyC/CorC family transporter [Ignavibacteriales bacterium]|nr:MAG: HlyC/CorC family transporter [Ignavibacteriales bacterium]
MEWHFRVIFLCILLLLSAFFSGSEVALFSLDRKRIKDNPGFRPLISRYLLNLIDHPRRLLVSVLIGNTIVNVAASIIAVSLALDIIQSTNYSKEFILTLQIIVLTILIILFSELTPKVWALKNPVLFSKSVAIPLYWFCLVIFPLAETITELIRSVVSKIKFDSGKAAFSSEEITELAELGHEVGALEEEEHGIIQSIVDFRSVAVHEIMIPRVDITSVEARTNLEELIELIKESGHSRIPLYKENLDEILGIIYAKDVLKYMLNGNKNEFNINKIARKPMYIPRTKMINDLMYEFQEKKMHIAIVVDEFGGTAGLITLEDIIEEIIGEIRDEYDKEENPVIKIDDYKYIVLGRISFEELNELLNTNIKVENEDFETLAGLVLNQAGHIPKEGYNFTLENFKFTVKEVTRKRIIKILVEKLSSE